MRNLLLIISIVALLSCEKNVIVTEKEAQEIRESCFDLIRLDDCQYYKRKRGSSFGLTHKGNCDNPYHKK